MNIFVSKLKEKEIYSDFDINLIPNWDMDVSKKSNAVAVSQSIVNIVTTKKGDMPFDPDFGTNVGSTLFQNLTHFSLSTLPGEIQETIAKYEPRVKDVMISFDPSTTNKNTLEMTIVFTTIYDVNEEHTIVLELSE